MRDREGRELRPRGFYTVLWDGLQARGQGILRFGQGAVYIVSSEASA